MSSNDNVVIQVENVSKTFLLPTNKAGSIKNVFTNIFKISKFRGFEKQKALENVSFEVKKGEFFGIVGRNGSGKSTLLKMLAGIYQPTNGNIKTQGKIVPFIELGVGFNPELSGRDNVFLNGALLGFSEKEIELKYKAIVDFAELERFMGQKLKNYSSGMQVRLAFSVATILADSDILLLDEVLAVGDADFQRKCFDYFKTLKKNKKTVVFVSHDMNAIREYCDKAILIDKSKLVTEGSAEKVAESYIKLFNDNSDYENRNDNRWGNGYIQYLDANIKISDKKLILNVSAKINRNMDSGNFGFTIHNAEGIAVAGTNSQIVNKKMGPYKKGDIVEFNWETQNLFSTGSYTLDLAVVSENHVDVYDWWVGAKQFKIINKQNTPYIVSPKTELIA